MLTYRMKKPVSGIGMIEVLIAVAIMAVLAMVVVPRLSKYVFEAKETTTKTNLQTFKNSVEAFKNDFGEYPAVLEDLVEHPVGDKFGKWEPYLESKSLPKDGWGRSYVYVLNPKGTQPPYELYSWGAQGEGSESSGWINAWEL